MSKIVSHVPDILFIKFVHFLYEKLCPHSFLNACFFDFVESMRFSARGNHVF